MTVDSALLPSVTAAPPRNRQESSALAAAAAHQVRGPLSAMRLRLELLADRVAAEPDETVRRDVAGILTEAERLSEVLDQVLAWGRAERWTEPAETVDAFDAAATRVDSWADLAGDRRLQLRLEGERLRAVQSRGALEQILDVLLDNALRFAPPGTEVTVSVYPTSGQVRVAIADQGPGMTAEEASRACEPFWQGGAAGGSGGTGLGLAMALSLLEASGGGLELGTATGGGLRAVAVLPAA